MVWNFIDLTGQKFERLTVIERYEHNKNKYAMWRCRCECGNETIVSGANLRSGRVRSCGCLASKTTHGETQTRLYRIWAAIKARCHNCNSTSFNRYGGRGIAMCEEWRNSFESFRDWALANGYDETAPKGQYTIDRIDNSGNYEPTNCHWATTKEQANNRRSNRLITYKGETRNMTEWANITGLSLKVLWYRMDVGWSVEKTLTTPARKVKTKNL